MAEKIEFNREKMWNSHSSPMGVPELQHRTSKVVLAGQLSLLKAGKIWQPGI